MSTSKRGSSEKESGLGGVLGGVMGIGGSTIRVCCGGSRVFCGSEAPV